MGVENIITAEKMARYRAIIVEIGIDERQKDEMIQVVADIMQAFVDNAFGVSAAQLSGYKSALKASFEEASNGIVQNENNLLISGHVLDAQAEDLEP